jgi:hypothetical protein
VKRDDSHLFFTSADFAPASRPDWVKIWTARIAGPLFIHTRESDEGENLGGMSGVWNGWLHFVRLFTVSVDRAGKGKAPALGEMGVYDHDPRERRQKYNDYGDEGWELVWVGNNGSSVFKRPKL